MRFGLVVGGMIWALAGAAQAEAGPWSAGLGVGTTGAEAQVSYDVAPRLALRGTLSVLSFDRDTETDGVDYQGELESTTGGAFLDWRPFDNWFVVTGGAYFGDRNVEVTATPSGLTQIGNVVYSPAQIGQLQGDIDMGEFAPYLGVAADWRFAGGGKWGMRLAAGVAFGEVETSLRAVGGLLESDPAFQQDIAREAAELQDEAEVLETYPVLSASLTYRY